MKKIIYLACISGFFAACNNNDDSTLKSFPAPGTVMASDKAPVQGDTLNHFQLSVKVVADSEIERGVYDVNVAVGPNAVTGKFMMPKNGEHLRPVLRRGPEVNTFVVGFKVKGDTTFYDYYQVKYEKQYIKMDYLKSYTL